MLKSIVFVLALMPALQAFQSLEADSVPLSGCSPVTGFKTNGQVGSSVGLTWNSDGNATEYMLWYIRQSDGYTSNPIYVTDIAHTYTGLSAGLHTFYIKKICGSNTSSNIGIEDFLQL